MAQKIILDLAKLTICNYVHAALNSLFDDKFSNEIKFNFHEFVKEKNLISEATLRLINFCISNDLIKINTDMSDLIFNRTNQIGDSAFDLLKFLSLAPDSSIEKNVDIKSFKMSDYTIQFGLKIGYFSKNNADNNVFLSESILEIINPMSQKNMRQWIYNFINVSSKLAEPKCILNVIQTGRPQWSTAFNQNINSPFDLEKFDRSLFESMMRAMHVSNVGESHTLCPFLDFKNTNSVLDIGGASGALGSLICSLYPNLQQYSIYELESAIELYKSIYSLNTLSNTKLNYIAGDFFINSQSGGLIGISPNQKYDVLILGWILHDWDDAQCSQILSKIKKHMNENSILYVIEAVLDENKLGDVTMLDLTMLLQTGGKERTLSEFENLFNLQGLKLEKIIKTKSRRQILEVKVVK